ncbi:DsbA family protein [Streptomyces sp. NPDC088258]|uniref:DsbA family protein n=1 Tax=Streptomyces sp. NPDC088258 TaxID=3365849 RepID=UPI00380C38D5
MPASSSSSPSSRSSATASTWRRVAIGGGVVAAAALLGVVSYTATKPDAPGRVESAESVDGPAAGVSAEPGADVYPELAKLARRESADPLSVGRADAPVVMVEYADFQCGYCGKFARDTEPALIEKYVEDGTLRIEWRNFPIFGKESEAAAHAAWAAGQQGRFWQFHSAAYADGAKEKGFGADRLTALARAAGVQDLERFGRDRGGEEAAAAVRGDQEEGYGLGATSTPSFLVNGRPIAGAQPKETFTRAIEAAHAAARADGGAEKGGTGDGGAEKDSGKGSGAEKDSGKGDGSGKGDSEGDR